MYNEKSRETLVWNPGSWTAFNPAEPHLPHLENGQNDTFPMYLQASFVQIK